MREKDYEFEYVPVVNDLRMVIKMKKSDEILINILNAISFQLSGYTFHFTHNTHFATA